MRRLAVLGPWLRVVGSGLLVAVAAGVAADAPSATRRAEPRIVVEPESFDFGRLRPAKAVQKEFLLRNHGRGDLHIEALSTSCGCTAALTESTTVKAGKSTPLRVTLTAPESPGRLVESVLVKSNDPARPTLEITLEATVVGPSPSPPAR
ncbi:MAG TPA: DUF1573 domain-containing protein [Vicinamibacteria bacterium]|nr:DUF1573 domain-containing protein [Vicinamibacteria bacterium]